MSNLSAAAAYRRRRPRLIVNYDFVPNELYALIEPTNTSLVGANGSNLDVVGSLNTVLKFNPNSPKFETKVIVAKNLCESILLGSDFLTQHNCILTFQI